jgi:hypothetical protein
MRSLVDSTSCYACGARSTGYAVVIGDVRRPVCPDCARVARRIAEMSRTGMSDLEIARELGLPSHVWVAKAIELGVPDEMIADALEGRTFG